MMKNQGDLFKDDKFKPGILEAIQCYLFAKVALREMRPTFEKVCDEALSKFSPVIGDRAYIKEHPELAISKPITKWADIDLISDEMAAAIFPWHKQEMAKHGYTTQGQGRCPFGVAEVNLIEAETLLINIMAPFTGLDTENLTVLTDRKAMISILEGFLIKAAGDKGINLNIIKEVTST